MCRGGDVCAIDKVLSLLDDSHAIHMQLTMRMEGIDSSLLWFANPLAMPQVRRHHPTPSCQFPRLAPIPAFPVRRGILSLTPMFPAGPAPPLPAPGRQPHSSIRAASAWNPVQLDNWTSVRCVRFLLLAVQPRRRAGSRSSRSHLRPDLNATCHFFHQGGRRAEGGEEGEGGEGRSEGGGLPQAA